MLQLKWVWKNMEGKRRFFIIGMLLSVVTSAMTVITPKLTQLLIDDVFRGSMEAHIFINIIAIMILVKLIRSCMRYLMVNCLEISSQKVLVTIERAMFANLVTQEPEFFDRNRTGDIISRATGDLDYIRHVVAWISYTFVDSVVMLLSAIIMLSTMHIGPYRVNAYNNPAYRNYDMEICKIYTSVLCDAEKQKCLHKHRGAGKHRRKPRCKGVCA